MIGGTVTFSTASSAFLLETTDANANNSIRSSSSSSSLRKSLNFNPRISCSASSSSPPCSRNRDDGIPKLKPFSRSMLDRALKEPSLIEKTEQELSDYCSVLDVEDSYDCWQAYFDLKYLEKEAPRKDVESLIVRAAEGGLKLLIRRVHGSASIYKAQNEGAKAEKEEGAKAAEEEVEVVNEERRIPDGIPRPLEEIEEEEKERMPDSPFTRLLRVMGKYPAWYTPPPDHA